MTTADDVVVRREIVVNASIVTDPAGPCISFAAPTSCPALPDMARITTSIDVDKPAEEVFAYATDPSRFPEWERGVVDGSMEKPGVPHDLPRVRGWRTMPENLAALRQRLEAAV